MKKIDRFALEHIEGFDCGDYVDRVSMMLHFLEDVATQSDPVAWVHETNFLTSMGYVR